MLAGLFFFKLGSPTRETEQRCLQNTLPYIPEGCDPEFHCRITLNSVIITCYTCADVKGSISQ